MIAVAITAAFALAAGASEALRAHGGVTAQRWRRRLMPVLAVLAVAFVWVVYDVVSQARGTS